jgi:hypothetical protein
MAASGIWSKKMPSVEPLNKTAFPYLQSTDFGIPAILMPIAFFEIKSSTDQTIPFVCDEGDESRDTCATDGMIEQTRKIKISFKIIILNNLNDFQATRKITRPQLDGLLLQANYYNFNLLLRESVTICDQTL